MRAILLMFVIAIATACTPAQEVKEEVKQKNEDAGLLSSIDAEGVYLKLKSGKFIMLYSSSSSSVPLLLQSNREIKVTSRDTKSNQSVISAPSVEDISQSIPLSEFDGLIINNTGRWSYSLHRATLFFNDLPIKTRKQIRNNEISTTDIVKKRKLGHIIKDFKDIPNDYRSTYWSWFHNLSDDKFAAMLHPKFTLKHSMRGSPQGTHLSFTVKKGLYGVIVNGDAWWINII